MGHVLVEWWSETRSLGVVEWFNFLKLVDPVLMLHFGDLQDMVWAERDRHQLVDGLTELGWLTDRQKAELVEICEVLIVSAIKTLDVDLASQLVKKVQPEIFFLSLPLLTPLEVSTIKLEDLVKLLFADDNRFDEHRSK